MSEQEFEVYLRLIAKLLRLSDAQREAISDELRDHMQARLDELMDAGVGREAAIHAAIEEFGDAAGLADQFTTITRQHVLRRRIMRTSIGVMATAAAIALAFLFMLPQNRPGVSGPADTFAQDKGAAAEADGSTASVSEESLRTRQLLDRRITVDFHETPLESVIDFLRETTGVNIFVNWTVLEQVGIDHDFLIDLTLRDTSAQTVLALILQLINPVTNGQIDYSVMDDVVMITSSQELEGLRVVRIYDCLDLMDPDGATQAHAAAQEATDPVVGEMGMGGSPGMASGGYGMGGGMDGGGYGSGMGGYGGGYGEIGAGESSSRRGSFGGRNVQTATVVPPHANELIQVVHTLLDAQGSVSSYDGMLVVMAGHKSHQRIQETLSLMRDAQAKR